MHVSGLGGLILYDMLRIGQFKRFTDMQPEGMIGTHNRLIIQVDLVVQTVNNIFILCPEHLWLYQFVVV